MIANAVREPCVVFQIDERLLALPVSLVDRTELAVEISPVEEASELLLGRIDVHGDAIAVYDTRRRLGIQPRDLDVSDYFILMQTPRRQVALVTDTVLGVVEFDPAEEPAPSAIAGTQALSDGTLLIHDVESFLDLAADPAADRLTRRTAV